MEVRRATVADLGDMARGMKVVADEGRWIATQPSATVAGLEERFGGYFEAGHVFFVLEDEGGIVGALGVHPAGPAGVLALGMWILPAHRGRGGGRLLIEAALAERPPDVHKIELEVFDDNAAAVGLYESTGFEREGLRRNHYRREDGSLRSALIMARLFGDAA
ncbi:MAG TPA: GNAT family N-acetyltransferase [Solirubrobacterales bacterium]|nr:GNAT family N-acetyltransferase [Solirubrobacterales bacterium]